jgi:PAS domain S-box-containing protein
MTWGEKIILPVIRGTVSSQHEEIDFQRTDGSVVSLNVAATAIEIDGHHEGAVIGISDITAKRSVQKAIRQSQLHYHHLYEHSPVMLETIDEQGCICDVNHAWLEKTGYRREEVIGKPADFLVVLDPVYQATSITPRFWEEGSVHDIPLRFRCKNGLLVDVLISVNASRDPTSQQTCLAVGQDVTDQRRVEKALVQRDAIQRAVSYAARQFLKEVDWEENITQVLEKLGKAADVSRVYIFENHTLSDETILMSQTHEWVKAGIQSQFENPYLQALSYQQGGFQRWQEILSRGEVVYGNVSDFPESEQSVLSPQDILSIVVVPIFNNNGWWGFIGFDECEQQREWTTIEIEALHVAASTLGAAIQSKLNELERKRFESQIQQAQRLESLGVLAGGIAHDFNNLLMGILGNADLALMELRAESPARKHLDSVVKTSQRAAELCEQMLAYSGRGKFVTKTLNLSTLVEEMAHLLEVSISKKVTVRYHFQPDLPPVEGDPAQLRQVIMNLILNASDAIGDQIGLISVSTGSIDIDPNHPVLISNPRKGNDGLGSLPVQFTDGTLPTGKYASIQVEDTGCGMDAQTLSRIFDPFFTTKFTGRGLGLAAVHGIVRSHHGTVQIESTKGIGSCFRVLIPVSDKRLEDANQPERKMTLLQGVATILMVDDEEIVLEVGAKVLEQTGYRVILAHDGREGVRVYAQHHEEIDLVILDLTMPEMNGEEVFAELVKINPEVQVILSSGYTENETMGRLGGQHLAGFLQKPYRPRLLLEKVADVLKPHP